MPVCQVVPPSSPPEPPVPTTPLQTKEGLPSQDPDFLVSYFFGNITRPLALHRPPLHVWCFHPDKAGLIFPESNSQRLSYFPGRVISPFLTFLTQNGSFSRDNPLSSAAASRIHYSSSPELLFRPTRFHRWETFFPSRPLPVCFFRSSVVPPFLIRNSIVKSRFDNKRVSRLPGSSPSIFGP